MRNNPDENTQINPDDDTVIGVEADDDTIISVPIDETVVGSVEIIDSTVIETVIPQDETVVGGVQAGQDDTVITRNDTLDHTVIPDTTSENYNTLMGAMLDTSVGVKQLLGEIDNIEQAPTEEPPRAESPSRYQLRHINGTKWSLSQPVIFGRLPVVPLRSENSVTLAVVLSPEGIVSSTHARVEMQGDVVVVTDLRSTNGTRVIVPGKPTVLLAPGDSMALNRGAIIDLGDGNRIEVLGSPSL